MQVVQVAQYENNEPNEDVLKVNHGINGNERAKKEKKRKFWVKEATFDKHNEAEASIENKRSKHKTNLA
ncbi:unnamed protein product [Rotaria sp. Silwood2]|nr:unnamed protein product [Rotaria sp. Silwood2]CAF3142210.1 unnamed protein product [Rotaria sp. Silwood2]CAF3277511.1 unnamed protein product [Rotaria sp. Silwood2]CAF3359088.1 unnamed protein product [Rotaria sp. Silwood2]CAF4345706.1 unnamed protein product [Rotaria sp. Silwood2]